MWQVGGAHVGDTWNALEAPGVHAFGDRFPNGLQMHSLLGPSMVEAPLWQGQQTANSFLSCWARCRGLEGRWR